MAGASPVADAGDTNLQFPSYVEEGLALRTFSPPPYRLKINVKLSHMFLLSGSG